MFFYNTEPNKTSNSDVVVSTAYFVLPCTTVKEFYIQEVAKRTFKKAVPELNEVFHKEKFFRSDGSPIESFKPRNGDYDRLGITAFVFDTKEEAELTLSKLHRSQVYFKMIDIFYNLMVREKENTSRRYYKPIPYFEGFKEMKTKILNLVLDKNNFYDCLVNLEKEWDAWLIKNKEIAKDKNDNF
jgi:hypothetical protein